MHQGMAEWGFGMRVKNNRPCLADKKVIGWKIIQYGLKKSKAIKQVAQSELNPVGFFITHATTVAHLLPQAVVQDDLDHGIH